MASIAPADGPMSWLAPLNEDAEETQRIEHVLTHEHGPARIHQFRMGNGLDIVVWPDHRAPVFSYHTWFGVGSRHETRGRTGMAHLFEHMMFKATTHTVEGEFDRVMEAHGAQTNAATWVDWTYYQEKLPAGNLELVCRLEADRMEHLVVDADQLESEREVVINERLLRVDNDPDGQLYERLYSEAYGVTHPYGWPTIGWMEDIRAITLEDCVAFYDRYYAPSSATVVIVGDVVPAEALALIQKYYGHLASRETAEETVLEPPLREEEVRVEMPLPITSEMGIYAWPGYGVLHPDHAAMEVLDEILTGGISSRLYHSLVVDSEVATQIGGWTPSWKYPGLYELAVTMRPGVSVLEAERRIDSILKSMCAQGPTERELLKASACLEADLLRGLSDTNNRARELGDASMSAGDFRWALGRAAALREVGMDDVLRVARDLFRPGRRTVVIGRPENEDGS
jgi:zinc protease